MNLEKKKRNEEDETGNNNQLKTFTVKFSNKKSELDPLSEYLERKKMEKKDELINSFWFLDYIKKYDKFN